MRLKRLLAFSIAICMLLTTAVASIGAFAADNAPVTLTDSDALDFMVLLGIMTRDEADKTDTKLTRENFAVYAANAMGLGNTKIEKRYFADVENDAFSVNAIGALVEKGCISVSDDHLFYPADEITYAQALKILICALGGKDYAEVRGGFPLGYTSVARQMGFGNVSNPDSTVDTKTAAELLYKALILPMIDIEAVGSGKKGDTITYKKSDENILSVYHNIKCGNGVVETVFGAGINSNTVEKENEVIIDGITYTISADNFDELKFIGSGADFFYKEDKKANTKDIIYIKEKSEKGKERIEISIDDFVAYTNNTITYWDGDKKVEKKIENPLVMYNGEELTSKIDETLKNLNKGYIFLCDSDLNGNYDGVIIYDFANFYVGASSEGAVYNKLISGSNVSQKTCTHIRVFDDMGKKVNFDDLKAGDSLSLAMSKSGKSALLYKSAATFNGTISGIKDGEEYSCVVNDTEYKVDKSYLETFKSQVTMGSDYYYTTDIFGKIAYVTAQQKSDYRTAYIMSIGADTLFDTTLKFKMLDENGKIGIYTLGDRLKLDGRTYRDGEYDKVKTALENQTTDLVVRYKATEENVIYEMDTPYLNENAESDTNTITSVMGGTKEKVWFGQNMISHKTILKTNIKIFYIPADKETPEDQDYIVGTTGTQIRPQYSIFLDAFNFSSLNGYADVGICRYNMDDLRGNLEYYRDCMVFDEVVEEYVTDDKGNGEAKTYVKVVGQNGEKKYEVRDTDIDFSNVSRGDVVTFYMDVNNKIIKPKAGSAVDVRYDCDKSIESQQVGTKWKLNAHGCRVYAETTWGDYYYNSYQLSYGTAVKKMSDNVLAMSGTCDDNISELIPLDNNVKVVVVEKDRSGNNSLRIGTFDDIITSESAGSAASTIVYRTLENWGRCMVVYNNK